jgi:hypothetical protein
MFFNFLNCKELVPNKIYFDNYSGSYENLTPIIINGNTRITESVRIIKF